jgi:hypothetical protein
LEILPQPRADIGGAAKVGLLQDLGDIIELNVFVLVHGSVPDAEEKAHSKKTHPTLTTVSRTHFWPTSSVAGNGFARQGCLFRRRGSREVSSRGRECEREDSSRDRELL